MAVHGRLDDVRWYHLLALRVDDLPSALCMDMVPAFCGCGGLPVALRDRWRSDLSCFEGVHVVQRRDCPCSSKTRAPLRRSVPSFVCSSGVGTNDMAEICDTCRSWLFVGPEVVGRMQMEAVDDGNGVARSEGSRDFVLCFWPWRFLRRRRAATRCTARVRFLRSSLPRAHQSANFWTAASASDAEVVCCCCETVISTGL